MKNFISVIFNFKSKKYNYYQGYHDLGLHFLLIFFNDYQTGISVFQRFSEFFLIENLSKFDDDFNIGYNFERVSEILLDIIQKINPDAIKLLNEYCYGKPSFALAWIITLFTHKISDIYIQNRLLDYFIVSHPIAVYYISALVLLEEIQKIVANQKNLVYNF